MSPWHETWRKPCNNATFIVVRAPAVAQAVREARLRNGSLAECIELQAGGRGAAAAGLLIVDLPC